MYRPTIEAAERGRIPALLRCATEADLFLLLHAQSRQLWGSEYQVAQEEADRLVSELQSLGGDLSVLERIVERARRRRVPQLLPLQGPRELSEAAGQPDG